MEELFAMLALATRTLLIAAISALGACGTSEVSNAKQERYFNRAESEEGRIRNLVKRFNWAKEQSAEYEELVAEAEGELTTLRESLLEVRRGNDKRAQELGGLRAETKKLEGEITAAKTALEAKKKEAAAAQGSLAQAEKERQALLQRLAALQTELPYAKRQIADLERRLK
jgi:chromosome segregation ATPase